MAGDPLHAAFLAYLTSELDEVGLALPWRIIDTRNTGQDPDATTPYVDFEITPQPTVQYTTGAPGSNLHQEQGQIIIAFKVPFGDTIDVTNHQDLAGEHAYALFRRWLSSNYNRFICDSRQVRLFSPLRLGFGEDDGGMWIETMAVSYELFHVG